MSNFIRKFFHKKETSKERRERLLELCEDGGMDAQVAIHELCRYLLGEDWYIADPVNNVQANAIIVDEIESKYRDANKNKKEGSKMNKQLKDTIELMQSEDFKERFKAEYLQLKIRIEGLSDTLKKYKKGTLTFSPKCSYEILYEQLVHMNNYLNILKERAKIEGIELGE